MRWKLSWLEILEPGPDGAALEELVAELLHLAAAACKSIVWSIVPWLRSWHFICDMKQGDVQFRACVTSWAPIFGQQPPSAARHMKLAMRVPAAAGGDRTFAVDVLFAQSFTKLKIISRRATTNCSICFQNRIGCSSLCRHPPVKKVWALSWINSNRVTCRTFFANFCELFLQYREDKHLHISFSREGKGIYLGKIFQNGKVFQTILKAYSVVHTKFRSDG